MYKWLIIKRKIESAIIFPFVLIGKIVARFSKNEEYSIYFFFPFHHIGGAEKVHYQICQAFQKEKCIIYFTRKSRGASFLDEFKKAGFVIKDISKFTDNKFIYPINFIYRGIVSAKINHQKKRPVVFNGQSNFGYKVSPWIAREIAQVDLIHALCSFSKIRIPFLEFYRSSLTVSNEIIVKHESFYRQYNMPERIRKNIQYINYGIELPKRKEKIDFHRKLKLLYVGRGSEEKRIHLIAEIAKEVNTLGLPFTFNFLGDVSNYIPIDLHLYRNLLGNITDAQRIDEIYRENDVLIVTSYTESGPLVVLEAMARGLAILSTPVGIVNEHVISGRNGFVFSTIDDENQIIKEAVVRIQKLNTDISLRQSIAIENMNYAYNNFGIERFQNNYRQFIKSLILSN